jgi:hypothetical protein
MKKDILPKVTSKVSELKKTATKLTQDANQTVRTVRNALQTGMATSKFAVQKAGTVLNKRGLEQGVEVTSKGVDMAAKTARFASKGAQHLANSLDKASASLKKVGTKLKE